eukprot:TRINITY_DN83710_c0_g1_i1.p2 TRINITY_DN83710_c0_g1~~TRINITY_DN83710_c0_g1_i1.p2  ORF type:complete len:170 (-),score=50.61 TRINITY_DN83710_c0_g1_i1:487-996(-)
MVKRGHASELPHGTDVFVMGEDGLVHGKTHSDDHSEEDEHTPPEQKMPKKQEDVPNLDFVEQLDEADGPVDRETEKDATSMPDKDPSLPQATAGAAHVSSHSTSQVAYSTSPEMRAWSQKSAYGQMSIRQLKERIQKIGADITGITEKEELIELLSGLEKPEDSTPFEL